MEKASEDAQLAKILDEEVEDFLHLHYPPDYNFSALQPIFRIPRKPLSDATFAAVREDLLTITFDERSPLQDSVKDKIYFVRRMFHHALRAVNSSISSPHRVRLGLDQRVWLNGSVCIEQMPWRTDVNHYADLMLSDKRTGDPLGCIEVRDDAVQFKQAMVRAIDTSILVGAKYNHDEAFSVITDLRTWWFQCMFLDGVFCPERVKLELKFDAEGAIDPSSLRSLMEVLQGLLLLIQKSASK